MIRQSLAEDKLLPFSEAMLSGWIHCYIADGYAGKALQAKLEEVNKGFDPPVSQEFLLALVKPYLKEEPMVSPIESALASNDAREIFKVVPLLAQLPPLEMGLIKQKIKEQYGRHVNMNDLSRAIKDEQRKRKIREEGIIKDIADIAKEWAGEHRDTWGYDDVYEVWRV
jgi:hypothetical protein